MLHLTTLLVLFAAAAFKSDHTALLAATLVSEAHTVFFLSRRLQVPVPLLWAIHATECHAFDCVQNDCLIWCQTCSCCC